MGKLYHKLRIPLIIGGMDVIQYAIIVLDKEKEMNETIRITSETEAHNEIIKASKANPNMIVTAYGRFGKLTIKTHTHQPRTDSADTIQTYQVYKGFFKNGEIINPTKTWLDKHNRIPCRSY